MGRGITIYWSQGEDEQQLPFNRQLLYLPPVNLYKDLLRHQNPAVAHRPKAQSGPLLGSSFYMCPAVRGKMSRIYFIPNPVETSVQVRDYELRPETGSGVPLTSMRVNSMLDTVHVRSDLTWYFFADEPLEVSFTSPYFHALEYLRLMHLPPATFDIGQWLRTFNVEYIFQHRDADLVIHEGDPLVYLEVHTERPVRFVRFGYTPEIGALAHACAAAPGVLGRWRPLADRYARFRQTQMRETILRHIAANVIGESHGET